MQSVVKYRSEAILKNETAVQTAVYFQLRPLPLALLEEEDFIRLNICLPSLKWEQLSCDRLNESIVRPSVHNLIVPI